MGTQRRPDQRSRTALVCCIIVFAALLTAACDGTDAKLEAVRAFSQNAGAAEPVFTATAADFYASCVRQYYWLVGSGEIRPTTTLETYCGAARDATQLWQKTNLTFLSYVRGLGALAGGQGNDYGIPMLKDEVLQAAGNTKNAIDENAANAVSQFAQWVVSSHFAQRRREELAKVTAEADQHVQRLAAGLERVATKRYGDQLWAEQQGLNAFYSAFLPGPPIAPTCPKPPCQAPVPLSQPLLVVDVLAYRQQWMRDRQALADRYAAIDAYVDAVDKIAKAHSGLATLLNGSKPAAAALWQQALGDFGRDLGVLSRAYAVRGGVK